MGAKFEVVVPKVATGWVSLHPKSTCCPSPHLLLLHPASVMTLAPSSVKGIYLNRMSLLS